MRDAATAPRHAKSFYYSGIYSAGKREENRLEFIKGYTYGYDGKRDMYTRPEAVRSMERMAALGGNWSALAFGIYQDAFSSSKFGFDYRYGVSDKSLEFAIDRLKALGLKVCLKPMLNCADGYWRAYITFPDKKSPREKDYWEEWFSCYSAFILHYAGIAREKECEMFCIGCEMGGTERKEEYWRELIKKVREVYPGPIVYDVNHGSEENVRWFDAVDFIGVSAYYPAADKPGESLEVMCKKWAETEKELAALSERHGGKKIIFMEIGCRSARGCAAMPWDFNHTEFAYDEDEQARYYEACFRAMWDKPYFAGFFWWDWYTFLPEGNGADTGFSIYKKRAEETVRRWYADKPVRIL